MLGNSFRKVSWSLLSFLSAVQFGFTLDCHNSCARPLTLHGNHLFVVSPFDEWDCLTCFDRFGKQIWECPFHSRINSWEIRGDWLFVFSKGSFDEECFFSCIDPLGGRFLWEWPFRSRIISWGIGCNLIFIFSEGCGGAGFFFTCIHPIHGRVLWELPFFSTIVSWEIEGECLFIFSRGCLGTAHHLTCIHPLTGRMLWERALSGSQLNEL